MMHTLVKQPANNSPFVLFHPSGKLSLKGRSLMPDPVSFYEPLIRWVDRLDARSIFFTIEIDYFNTSSSKMLTEMLKIIDGKDNVKEFVVYWGFETDDEEILMKGQILEEKLKNAQFHFRELA